MSHYLPVPLCSVSAAWSSQGWLICWGGDVAFAFGYKDECFSLSLTYSLWQCNTKVWITLFFIFEFIWVHNGAERWVRCRFSWLASKVVSSLKLIYFHIIIVIIIVSVTIITIILYLEYLDFSLFSFKARKKHLINTKLCFWGINDIPFPHLFEKKKVLCSFPVSSRTLQNKCHITELVGLVVHMLGPGAVLSLVLKGKSSPSANRPRYLPNQGCLTTALVSRPSVDSV